MKKSLIRFCVGAALTFLCTTAATAGDPVDGPNAKIVQEMIKNNEKLRQAIISDLSQDDAAVCVVLYPVAKGVVASQAASSGGMGDLILTMMVQFSLYRSTAPGADHTTDPDYAKKVEKKWNNQSMWMMLEATECITRTSNILAKSQ